MDMLQKLEVMIASWYKDVPHLPEGGRKWLRANIWWIVLIGVILGGLGIVGALFLGILASSFLIAAGGVYGATVGGIGILVSLLYLGLGAACVVLGALAISPLKAGHKKGWLLLFATLLLNVVWIVVNFLFSFDFFGVVWALLMTAVIGYFLFEIRDRFIVAAKVTKDHTPKKTT